MASMKKIKALSKISTKDCQNCWKNKKNSQSCSSRLGMKRISRAKRGPKLKSTAIKRFINFLWKEKNEPPHFKSIHFKFVYFLIGFRNKEKFRKKDLKIHGDRVLILFDWQVPTVSLHRMRSFGLCKLCGSSGQ
jgi:hypothetical protein